MKVISPFRMSRTLGFLLISMGIAYGGVPGADYENDRFVVSVAGGVQLRVFDVSEGEPAGADYESIDRLIAELNVIRIAPYYSGNLISEEMRRVVGRMYLMSIADAARLDTAIDSFDNDQLIEFAEPLYLHYLDYVPNDPLISSWYHLGNIESYLAWDFIRGDSTSRAVVGIVDSGVYYDHPDLEPNMWINEFEDINGDGRFTSADVNGLDDDGNGYVDDVVGYDLAMGDPFPMEPIPWHGTHVAGCATMATDNEYGGAATGWAARIMAVKAARDNDPNSISHGYAGIIYAAENGSNVINLSWGRGGGFSQSEQNIINSAYNLGVVVVAAAGNSNSSAPHWPSAYDNVVAVAATDANDVKADFSNFGSWVDISGPGVGVISTWDHSSFTSLSGTSMSSPVTAGVVCLIRAANPDWSVDDVVERLLATADNIDFLNPGYEGLLGSGRVNAAAAIGRGLYPRLNVRSMNVTLTEDDGDGVLNPAEACELVLTLENLWADASNVRGVLRSDSDFTVADSTADFGDIDGNGGSSDNSDTPFAVDVDDDALVGNHEFTLALTADGYVAESELTIYVSLQQAGFPGNIPDIIESPPVMFDFDGDGQAEIVISANDHKFYSFESNGSETAGWPVTVDDVAPNGAAIGDIDNDGDFEVIGASRSGSIYAWNDDGSTVEGFPYDGNTIMFSTPSLGDIDGVDDLEIAAAGFSSKKVYVIKHDGSDFPGWPYQGAASFFGSVALADIDNDALLEIIACDFNGDVHVWNHDQSYVDGFPVTLSGPIRPSPSVADIDGDENLNIVAATFAGDIYVLDSDGSVLDGWPVAAGSNIKSSPAIGDVDHDGHLEIVIGDNAGNLHVLNSNGQPQSGFPVSTGGSFSGSPVLGDIDNDSYLDIVIGSTNGLIHCYNGLGQVLPSFPIPTFTGGGIEGSPGLADIDGDGDAEIVVGVRSAGNNLEVIDYKAEIADDDFPWPFYCKDIYRNSYYGDFVTGIDDETDSAPFAFELLGNYPNPFNANTIIKFTLPAPEKAELAVYDLLGRRIRTLISGSLDAGQHEMLWNGRDDVDNSVASGVYFYNLKFGEQSISRRMVMLK